METQIIITVTEKNMQVALQELDSQKYESDLSVFARANKALEMLGLGNCEFSDKARINRMPIVNVPQKSRYAAVYTPSGLTCITVLAFDEAEAHNQIAYQLHKNPPRKQLYEMWKEQGFKIVKI